MPNTLPLNQINPESMVLQQIKQGQQAFKQKYSIMFQELNRRAPQLGQAKYNALAQQVMQKAQMEAIKFRQEATAALRPFQAVNQLRNNGMIDPEKATEAKWRMALPASAANAMFPEQPDNDPMKRLRDLDMLQNRLNNQLNDFYYQPSDKKATIRGEGILKWLLGKKVPAGGDFMVRDYGNDKPDPETGFTIPAWRKANEADLEQFKLMADLKKRIVGEQNQIMSNPDTIVRMRGSMPTPGMATKVREEAIPNRPSEPKTITKDIAMSILKEADGDVGRAREIAKSRGYKL